MSFEKLIAIFNLTQFPRCTNICTQNSFIFLNQIILMNFSGLPIHMHLRALILYAFLIFHCFSIMKTIFRFIFKLRDDWAAFWQRNAFGTKCWTKHENSNPESAGTSQGTSNDLELSRTSQECLVKEKFLKADTKFVRGI